MEVKSYGKINLSLDVISKRDDGYHNIETIMQKINLYDIMKFEKIEKGFVLNIDDNTLSNGKDNLIYKSWKLLCDYTKKELPIKIDLKKNIPIAAGLAGGTGNGATTLKALNEIYNLNINDEKLMEISLSLGADFPYMICGGTVLAKGIGEKIEKLDDFSNVNILVINPGFGVSTKDVYEGLTLTDKKIKSKELIENLKYIDVNKLENLLYNKMEDTVFEKHNEIKDIKKRLELLNGIALMSGSGATVFSFFKNDDDLDKAYNYFIKLYPKTYKTYTVGGYYEF